jgi:hypothetical protein
MASIYGELIRAQLHLSASDLTPVASGLIYLNTSSHQVKWYANAAWKTAVDLDTAQTLTNKTLVSAVIDAYVDINEETTPATPSAGAVRLYAKSDQKLYTKDSNGVENEVGSGSGGSGEKNYVTNPSADSAITGWASSAGGLTVTRTTTASELPREYTTGTGIKIVAPVGDPTNVYVYYDFTLDDIDLNKKLKIQWSQKQFGTYAASDFEVYIASQSARGTILHTPDVTLVPAYDGVFTASFDTASTATLSLVIRARVNMATDAGIVISDVIVGPGTITAAAPIGFIGTFTPVFTGVTVTVVKAVYARLGDRVKMDVEVVAATDATANVAFQHSASIPGITLDTSKYGLRAAIGSATGNLGANTYTMTPKIDGGDVTFSIYNEAGSLNATLPVGAGGFDTGDRLSFSLEFYVSEWAGAPNYAGQNDVEYASVGGTWNADSTTTVYGPGGFAMGGTLTSARLKTITWQTPVQATDRIQVWGSEDQVNWFEIVGARLGTTGYVVNFINDAGDLISGVQWLKGAASNQTIVRFAQYMGAAADGSPTTDWPSSLAFFVVTKSRVGVPVGFGHATTTQSGLVNTGTQSFAGEKTFSGSVIRSGDTAIFAYDLADQTFTESGGQLNFGTEVTDTLGEFTSNTFTVTKAGTYKICVHGSLIKNSGTSTIDTFQVRINRNGSLISSTVQISANSTVYVPYSNVVIIALTVGQTITANLHPNFGGGRTFSGTSRGATITIERV